MLCEGRLWRMTYGDLEEVNSPPPEKALRKAAAALLPGSTRRSPVVHRNSPEQICNADGRPRDRRASGDISPPRSSALRRAWPGRDLSPEIEIPDQARSCGDAPFLVPSFCQSICQNYSDLHIGGDQVLPLSANDGELRVGTDSQAPGPFLQSCDVPPAVEDSPPGQTQGGLSVQPLTGGSTRWRLGSGRDRSFLFQGCEGPFSNSLLNRYLEHKLLDLYQQYMTEKSTLTQAAFAPCWARSWSSPVWTTSHCSLAGRGTWRPAWPRTWSSAACCGWPATCSPARSALLSYRFLTMHPGTSSHQHPTTLKTSEWF